MMKVFLYFSLTFFLTVHLQLVSALAEMTEERAQEIAEKCLPACAKSDAIKGSQDFLEAKTDLIKRKIDGLNIGKDSIAASEDDISSILDDLNAEISETEIRMILNNGVLFSFDKSDLRADAVITLRKILSVLQHKNFKKQKIKITGHTDSIGTVSYNVDLSKRRASSVSDWLAKSGVAKKRLKVTGLGEGHPVETNETSEGRQQNRRVEIVVRK